MFEWLRRLFVPQTKYADRIYYFELPYKIQAMYLHYGLIQMRKTGIFQRLPKDLQKKWERSAEQWHDLRVTKEDLDRIDEATWRAIADKLDLKWKENV